MVTASLLRVRRGLSAHKPMEWGVRVWRKPPDPDVDHKVILSRVMAGACRGLQPTPVSLAGGRSRPTGEGAMVLLLALNVFLILC